MSKAKRISKKTLAIIMSMMLMLSVVSVFATTANAVSGTTIDYVFTGNDKDTSGYAEGTITLSSDTDGTYSLYWADDTKALEGYYAITSLTVSANNSKEFKFGYHTAIPKGATKIIATTTDDKTVANAVAVYDIPAEKQLNAGKLLYTFNSYSDVHIADDNYYVNCDKNWAQALKFGVDKDTDFIVTSGDMNSFGRVSEWERYQKILADSDYLNSVYEANGNHDLRDDTVKGNTAFVRATGTDNTIANFDANKPYYYVTEKTTGDIFIFMALETNTNPSASDEFSQAQITWLSNLLKENYGKGKNIYIVEHSPINGFGAGDRMSNPYYKAHLSESFISTVQFKNLLIQYPDVIWMSGHTHEDFDMGYNYSDENGTAANMIHNPAVAGSTKANSSDNGLDYNGGAGYNSQGYYVETYENQVVFYGANLTDELIYPAYSYVMEGSRQSTEDSTNPTETAQTATTTAPTGATLPSGTETTKYYFANTLNWDNVGCYSWSSGDTTTVSWPGQVAKYYGTSENGVDLYYCEVPSSHTFIIWNNMNNGYQTKDIELDGTNNFFTPSTTVSSKSVPVTASVWEFDEPTDPSETTTEPTTDTTPDYSLMGDTNGNGEVDISDATAIQMYIAEIKQLSTEALSVADVTFDGKVDIRDATTIQMYIAKIITTFPYPAPTSDTTVTSSAKKSVYAVGASTLTEELALAKQHLDTKYTFSSYDQYQALKKLYYQYKAETSADETVLAQFETAIAELTEIAEHIGTPTVYPVGDTYYFENTYDWSVVNCYAWNGSSKNAEWPGTAMQKVGTNGYHDVYGIKFEYAGQYTSLIFNNGTDQTVDIGLNTYAGNCFYLDGNTSNGKLTVGDFTYSGGETPTTPPVTTQAVEDSNHYALCYYNATSH
ncbi:MAG: starch-binding protein, partial [Ruminococcus sp.]